MGVSDKTAIWISLAGLFGMLAGWAMPHAPLNMPILFWKVVWWISFPAFIFSIVILFLSVYKNILKPKIQGIRHMWPIIIVGLGVFIFGIGIVWYLVQLPKLPSIVPSASISEIINQSDINVMKKQARLYLLKRELPKIESLKKQYEVYKLNSLNIYLNPKYSTTEINRISADIDVECVPTIGHIIAMAIADFNEELDLNAIDTTKYDLNMPFPEEEQIKEKLSQYKYRKAKYEYLSGKDKIDKLIQRIKEEINENERIIEEYAKKLAHLTK